MIDYTKEKYNFEYFCRDYGDINLTSESINRYKNKQTQKMWTFWKARAKEAQKEVNKEREQATEYFTDCEYLKEEIKNLTSKHGSAIGKLHFTEKKLGEAQQEISELKAKLAKYESDDVVIVLREPTINMIRVGQANWLPQDVYKAMIEAGKIK